jgi:glycosyltransferase involved in cell wall biosynthesis
MSTEGLPLVSVLIVHYNRPASLEKAFYALKQNLTYSNLEFVVTDDCSGPEAIEQVKNIPFDKFVFAEKNEGLGANTNKGIKACSGKYILELQDDHVLMPGFSDFLQKGLQILQSNNKIGIVRFLLGKTFKVNQMASTGCLDYCIIPKQIWKNGERGFYQYSDWPHLKPATLHDRIGYYLERMPMQYTENEFNIRYIKSDLSIAYLKEYQNIFETHIVQSYRNTAIVNRQRRSIKNETKNFFKKKLPVLNLLKFYYWVLKYDYNTRQL